MVKRRQYFNKNVEVFELANLIGELNRLVFKFLADYKSHSLPGDILKFKIKSDLKTSLFPEMLLRDFLPKNDINQGNCDVPGYSFKIGNVDIKNPLISAPLAGISDNTYRIFARFFGSALTYTEMITSYGIYYRHKKSLALTDITDYERPCALQIFGSDPEIITEAALQIEDRADIIDINMGCPVPKILKARSGGYLVQDEAKIEKIITGLSSVLKKPLTVKTRIGWDSNNINILNIAKIAEGSGASAISIHGRTVRQGFLGNVDYGLIKKVKEKVKIPVIVSGDIDSPLKAKEILDYTGCDGIMIGRAVKGRLWLMMNMLIFIIGNGGRVIDPEFNPGIDWKKEFSKIYLKFLIHFKVENKAVREFRKHLCWIFKGSGGISRARSEFFKIESFKDAINCINNV
ncbi:MAG: tRNA dihydrouridine synthase DusB [Actinobacteria bacterium]|nr:tRNA dihydrouridine synthase DusB [Actinomycetota bacterium]